ncbi:hypothetical protein D9758_002096 [Tetrapyrgos nigripes]|uniref:XPG-I domain-containing protein n=1 Tax=Tetrapyrgos nigripes TaxID=182062 RepID=A0A8H5GT32_9AGAR|nr:hypothetical protein D9758_002096 [Tetrapyrgos nigripes]
MPSVRWDHLSILNVADSLPGKVEAELARLNGSGVINAVVSASDDVVTFLFGAQTVIKNFSPTLFGNRSNPATNANDKATGSHVSIIMCKRDFDLTRGEWFLLHYSLEGIMMKLGPKAAYGLASSEPSFTPQRPQSISVRGRGTVQREIHGTLISDEHNIGRAGSVVEFMFILADVESLFSSTHYLEDAIDSNVSSHHLDGGMYQVVPMWNGASSLANEEQAT